MEKIEILKMTMQDYEQIKDVLNSEFDDFWTKSILKSELMGENKNYIVAKQNEEIVGFAGVMLNQPEMEIMNIVTKKNERGKGIGTLLLNKIIEIAKNNRIQTIFLEVGEKNYIAKKMYEKAGFCEIGLRKNYYHAKESACLMSKNVNNFEK